MCQTIVTALQKRICHYIYTRRDITLNATSLSKSELEALLQTFSADYAAAKDKGLNLDLTRGKPSSAQLDLANDMDQILNGDFTLDGTDLRNYGGVDGLPATKQLFAAMGDVSADSILVGGNSSLTLMQQSVMFSHVFGLDQDSWLSQGVTPVFICPVPGYDRHFSVCEQLGIKMVTVAMDENGPDMDAVEALIESNPDVRGMWCVPRFSNPTGIVYSDEVVARIAKLGKIAHPSFKVFYDNAYTVHHLERSATPLTPIQPLLQENGTEESVIQFGSTSKITFAGAGVAYLSAGPNTLAALKKHLSNVTIGPDKLNQAKHVKFLKDKETLLNHMDGHAAILKPKFDSVLSKLDAAFTENGWASWTVPEGGYFVSLDVQASLAKKVVKLAAEAGVKLTPAGATFPYGDDPKDENIRIAPSVPPLAEVDAAMDVLVTCVQLATVEQALAN